MARLRPLPSTDRLSQYSAIGIGIKSRRTQDSHSLEESESGERGAFPAGIVEHSTVLDRQQGLVHRTSSSKHLLEYCISIRCVLQLHSLSPLRSKSLLFQATARKAAPKHAWKSRSRKLIFAKFWKVSCNQQNPCQCSNISDNLVDNL
jgi:hypothetical protein